MLDRESSFYILPASAPPDDRVVVLKHNDTFGVFDRFGDVFGAEGLFHEDTRYLSGLMLRVGNHRPLLLSSTTQEADAMLTVNLSNSDLELRDGTMLSRGTLHIERTKFLFSAVCHERLRIFNYGAKPVVVPVRISFDADFADIFEVRGSRRARRGVIQDPVEDGQSIAICYKGLDGRARVMRLSYSERPSHVGARDLEFEIELAPGAERHLHLSVSCLTEENVVLIALDREHHELVARSLALYLADIRSTRCEITTSSARFNDWIARSLDDLRMMLTDTPYGPYPYAGVPWFSTAFGRDGIITALEMLWIQPRLARSVLRYLSATQSDILDPTRAAEPGKIMHETRNGEMANLGEVPFGQYYGSVDATPLYIMLAGAYYEATSDRALIEEIWPHIEFALDWIERYGDRDRDGFVEYVSDPRGLIHQGWKDSADSVFHSDGSDPSGPIALCEVQGYVYGAYSAAKLLAGVLGKRERAEHCRRRAEELSERFDRAFWCEELGSYALALDSDKRPCRVLASNAGHCLFSRIARPDRAARLVGTLFHGRSFSGWGIRTLAKGEARYNPMSYHNGSIWPHDNAMIALGLAEYGYRNEALRVLMGLYEASIFFDTKRLPELFCGFDRHASEAPTLYPVACSPQAWASGAPFMLLRACLGMHIDAPRKRLSFCHPVLPSFLQEVRIEQLAVGDETIDLIVHRYPDDVGINVLGRTGPIEVVNIK